MSTIIDELLLLASVRSQDVPVDVVDMKEVVLQAQRRLAPLIRKTNTRIKMPSQWPAALGYAPWIEEIWVNYISNAIKYGGDPPRMLLGASPQSGDTIKFLVRDNGPGIPLEKQNGLFVPFQRLDQAKIEGHGLGLSIVRRIAEKLGGTVGVRSNAGGGSTFMFSLPAVSPLMKISTAQPAAGEW